MLSPRLKDLQPLPFSSEEQRQEAVARASKMSIQGVQPKLSSRLNVAKESFEMVGTGGDYILKPQSNFPEVPENEDLTMRLAASVGVETPLHGLLYSKDNSLTYFIKRFDRDGRGKVAVEDFAQLSGKTRDTKYSSSMEQVASVIDSHCTFPLVEKVKLFRLTMFNYLIGNEDMHLKNFSLITREGKVELSPAYDLVNTTIAIGNASEEIALPINGKKRKLSRSLLVEYFGRERLGLQAAVVNNELTKFKHAMVNWGTAINDSFLSGKAKERYSSLLRVRRGVLFPET
jgi:serine/threonine-protein kinase HipA